MAKFDDNRGFLHISIINSQPSVNNWPEYRPTSSVHRSQHWV